MSAEPRIVLDADAIARMVRRIAHDIVEKMRGTDRVGLVGIHRGGVPLARMIGEEIQKAEGKSVPVGTIDITLYRDDAATALPDPKIAPSEISFEVSGWDVVLCDDVLMTGRTVRAAIDHVLDYGRPRRIWLAALCDRGGRELPIAADFVGTVVEVPAGMKLDVSLEGDGPRRALLVPAKEKSS
jgi:pyrimidine operon attenuation protein/uracil phosphoribosyltransferase